VIFSWLRRHRRERIGAAPFPNAWLEIIRAKVLLYSRLSEERQAFVRRYVQVFVAEKNWEGCRGLKMTDEIRVTIAAQVAIFVLGRREVYFDRLISILVYPTQFVVRSQNVGSESTPEWEMGADGQAADSRVVVLAWPEVERGGLDDDEGNVVFHEFAHQYDRLTGGEADGMPPLDNPEQYRRWGEVTDYEFRRLRHRCRRGLPTFLGCYGATDRREFFAVATETFFVYPQTFRVRLPKLYQLLSEVYRLDPATDWPEPELVGDAGEEEWDEDDEG
jgi:Mlc titration factor MtfA (ptsG expression regulator)